MFQEACTAMEINEEYDESDFAVYASSSEFGNLDQHFDIIEDDKIVTTIARGKNNTSDHASDSGSHSSDQRSVQALYLFSNLIMLYKRKVRINVTKNSIRYNFMYVKYLSMYGAYDMYFGHS